MSTCIYNRKEAVIVKVEKDTRWHFMVIFGITIFCVCLCQPLGIYKHACDVSLFWGKRAIFSCKSSLVRAKLAVGRKALDPSLENKGEAVVWEEQNF